MYLGNLIIEAIIPFILKKILLVIPTKIATITTFQAIFLNPSSTASKNHLYNNQFKIYTIQKTTLLQIFPEWGQKNRRNFLKQNKILSNQWEIWEKWHQSQANFKTQPNSLLSRKIQILWLTMFLQTNLKSPSKIIQLGEVKLHFRMDLWRDSSKFLSYFFFWVELGWFS